MTVDASAINSQVKTVDARSSNGAVVLIGNANADAIYAGSGGSTLYGGSAGSKAVKDNLYGGTDYFFFSNQGGDKGKENDIIGNYEAGDVIVLDSAPDSLKADGKNITLTWNDNKGKAGSTLVINGKAQDSTMKKFNNIDATTAVSFVVAEFLEDGEFTLPEISSDDIETYTFDLKDAKSDNAKALKNGVEWGSIGDYVVAEEDGGSDEEVAFESNQYAASEWFEEAVATDKVIGSELDSILDVKAISTASEAQFNGDAYFTGIGQADQSAVATFAARHRAKK